MRPETAMLKLVAKHDTRDPFTICREEGLVVTHLPLGDIRGYYRHIHAVHIIVLNTALSPLAARFACAHELAHWVFDKGSNRIFMDYFTYMLPGRLETRADQFAAHLVFGEPPMYQDPITAWEMADALNVPVCNVNARLIELGIFH